jgi:hypothetical protein
VGNIVSVVAGKFWRARRNRLFFFLEWVNAAIRRNNDRWCGLGIDVKTEVAGGNRFVLEV